MLQPHSRWLVLAGLGCALSLACSDDGTDSPGGSSAGASGSSAGTNTQGGTSAGSGGSSSTAGSTSTSGAAGSAAGSAGAATGGGGQSGGGTSAGTGGTGGTTAGTGGSSAEPTAVANIVGVGPGAGNVEGTATFTQGAEMTKLVISLTKCPDGEHASHLHENKDCGDAGNAAGSHWMHGEDLGNYTCVGGKVTHEVSKPKATWTVGDGSDTDVTKHSFMVHEQGDDEPGGRIGCGLIDKK